MLNVLSLHYFTAKLEVEKLVNELDQINKSKEQICSQLLDVKRKVSALESDFYMLIQVNRHSLYVCSVFLSQFLF